MPNAHRIAACALLALAAHHAPLGAQVRGRVTSALGAPIEGARVHGVGDLARFVAPDPGAAPLTATAADGTFALDAATAAAWPGLIVEAPDHVRVALATDHASSRPIVLARGRVLAGTVRAPDGTPLADVRVEARDWLAVSPLFRQRPTEAWGYAEARTAVRTNARGQFVLRGTYEHALALIVGGDGFERRQFGPLSAGDPFDTRVAPVPTVKVRVTDDQGEPLAGLAVQLWRTGEGITALQGQARGRTDAEGGFAFEWFDGVTTLGVLADDGRWLASTELEAHRPTLALTVRRDELEPAPQGGLVGRGRIRGRVVDPTSGLGVAGARVGVVPGAELRPGRFVHGDAALRDTLAPRATTDADGSFELSALPGPYTLVASWTAESNPGWRRNPTPVPVEVPAEEPVEGLTLALQPLVAGRGVLSTEGSWAAGLWVEALAAPGDRRWRPRFAPIGQDGRFDLGPLAAGIYGLRIQASGGARQARPLELGQFAAEWPGTVELECRAGMPTTLSGRVTGDVPTQRIAVLSLHPNEVAFGRTSFWGGSIGIVDRDGAFRCAELPGPRRVVVADLLTGLPLWTSEPTEVEAERTLDIEVRAHRLDVRIADALRLEQAWLAVLPQGENRAEAFGLALHRDRQPPSLWLPAGSYVLRVQRERGDGAILSAAPTTITVGADTPRRVELR